MGEQTRGYKDMDCSTNWCQKEIILRRLIMHIKEKRIPNFWGNNIKSKKKMTIHYVDWIFLHNGHGLIISHIFLVQCHLSWWGVWEQVQVSDEKPYIIIYIHTSGTDRWSSNAASHFSISVCLLHAEYNWEHDHHYTHFGRFSP